MICFKRGTQVDRWIGDIDRFHPDQQDYLYLYTRWRDRVLNGGSFVDNRDEVDQHFPKLCWQFVFETRHLFVIHMNHDDHATSLNQPQKHPECVVRERRE